MDLIGNKNVNWISLPYALSSYTLFVVIFWFVLHARGFEPRDCWSFTNVFHGLTTFVILHWVKGNPDTNSQGQYNGLTLWEQIDAGVAWTWAKKYFMLVPTIITLVACKVAEYDPVYVVMNCAIFLICILAKIPQMHRVRVFGINSTPGIDDKMQYSPSSRNTSKETHND